MQTIYVFAKVDRRNNDQNRLDCDFKDAPKRLSIIIVFRQREDVS